jgi:hypothetical protein
VSRIRAFLTVCALAAACTNTPPESAVPTAAAPVASPTSPAERSAAPGLAAVCRPTDQDQFVYNPDRLTVVAACIRVSGTVAVIRHEADGDLHILLDVDPAFRELLRPSNEGEELGDLVIEPVCVRKVTQADAKATCAKDGDPLTDLPHVGLHVWMEGRYVLDTEHGSWAELHPLYRWGDQAAVAEPPSTEPPSTEQPTPSSDLASPTPEATPEETPVATEPPALAIRLAVTSPVSRNRYAKLTARTHAAARCSIEVDYASGASTAAGLGDKTVPASGVVSWSWKVGGRTTKGTWPIYVSCTWTDRSGYAEISFTVR